MLGCREWEGSLSRELSLVSIYLHNYLSVNGCVTGGREKVSMDTESLTVAEPCWGRLPEALPAVLRILRDTFKKQNISSSAHLRAKELILGAKLSGGFPVL